MLFPKIILVVLVGVLAIYHHAITTTISSIASNFVGLTDVLAPVPAYAPDDRANLINRASALTRQKFEDVWDSIRSELLVYFEGKRMPVDAQNWYKHNLDYNVPGGKLNRGMTVVGSVEILRGRSLSDDEYIKAAVLGWCVELLQAFFLVLDDIMDRSSTRRGQPCWYKNVEVGNIAINDATLLEAAIYQLLKSHFREEPYYVDLLELFHEVSQLTSMGQLMDLITAPEHEVDLKKFSLAKHHTIAIYKTAYYSFYLPVALAMHMTRIPRTYTLGTSTLKPYELALDILLPVGEYFQIQDDFLDYAGTPELIGKIGTDIVDNKCSWCINIALAASSAEQRKVLEENYGQKDVAKEAMVKGVYDALGISAKYEEYEEEAYRKIVVMIEQIPEARATPTYGNEPAILQRQVFRALLDRIYKRSK